MPQNEACYFVLTGLVGSPLVYVYYISSPHNEDHECPLGERANLS